MQRILSMKKWAGSFIMWCAFLLVFQTNGFSQNILVKGRVLDQENKPVAFATIAIGNTGKGVACDETGKFGLYVNKQDKSIKLNVSSVGYKPKQISVDLTNKTNPFIYIHLDPQITDIDEITVTGQSVVQQVNKTAYNVVAIDAQSMHNTTENLATALATVPGVKLRESGGVGSDMRLSLDGFTGRHIKLFIDGVPQEGVGGSFGLNNIPINFAERIEVYRGVVPVDFGADAIGGIINIVTGGNKRRTFVDASYSYGSFNTHKSYVNIGHTSKNGLMYEINAFQNYSDNSYYIDTPVKDFETGVWDSSKPEHVKRFHDTYHNEAVIGKVGLVGKKFADRLVFGLAYAQNDKEIQNGVVQEIVYGQKRSNGHSVMPSLEYKKRDLFAKGMDVNFTFNYNMNLSHNIDTSAYEYNWHGDKRYTGKLGEQSYQDSEFDNDNWNGTFTANYPLGEKHSFVLNHVLTAFNRNIRSVPDAASGANAASLIDKKSRKNITGLSYRFNYKEVWNLSVFGKYYNQYSSGPKNTSSSGYNYIETSTNADAFGYGTAGAYSFLNDFQGKLSYEKALRLPTTDELFGDEDLEMGAVELKPEKSNNFNISLSYTHKFVNHSFYVEGDFIYRDTKDYIRRKIGNYSGGLMYASHENHGRVITKGINAQLRYTYSNWFSLGGNFTSLDIRDNEKYVSAGSLQESTTYKVRMPNVPYLFSNADASFYLHNFFGKGNILTIIYDNYYVHEFPLYWENHGSSNKKRVPDQFAHNMRLTYSLKSGRYNFSLECKNFTDEQLFDNFSLQKAGRAFYGKIRYYFNK